MSHWTSTESPVATQILTEEERRIVLSQITSLDRFAAASDNFSNGSRAIVCVPPRAEGDNERWIAVNPLSQQIDFNIRQPDQNRTVLYASENKYGCNSYYYNDQLSCCIIWTIIATVIFSILTTPVILLCCIPMIKKMKQAERKFEERDNFGARKEYKSCCNWCIGPTVWITVILPIVLIPVILVVAFAAVGIF